MSRVAVVGTGVIGAGWVSLCLARGHDVSAFDPATGAEERLRADVQRAWPVLQRLGAAEDASPDRLTFADDVSSAVSAADFIQENGPERIDLKQQLFAEIDGAARRETVIASSSSGLLPSHLQQWCEVAPERVLVGHPFNPAHLIPLVEVVPGAATHPDVVQRAMSFYVSLGKRPILVRQEQPGHVTNRLQAALWQEAYSLVERGVVSVADVDAAISEGPGLRWALLGPLVNQHLSGGSGGLAHTLQHLGPPAEEWMKDLRPARLSSELIAQLVDGLAEELDGVDEEELVASRDEMLESLLTMKRDRSVLRHGERTSS